MEGGLSLCQVQDNTCPEAFSVEEYPYKRISQQGTDWSRSPPDFLSTHSPRREESKERQNKVWAESPGVAAGIKDTGANSCEKEQEEKITAKK